MVESVVNHLRSLEFSEPDDAAPVTPAPIEAQARPPLSTVDHLKSLIPDSLGPDESATDDLNEIGKDLPLDPVSTIPRLRRQFINKYSSEFGPNVDDPNEIRSYPDENMGFFERILPEGFMKNTAADFRAANQVLNVEGSRKPKYTDADLMMQDLRTLVKNEPELMASEEGEAFAKEIYTRVNFALNQDEASATELLSSLAEFGYNNPEELTSLVLDETLYNPLAPVLVFAAYRFGGIAGNIVARKLLWTRMMNALRMGTARQRLAAFSISNVMNVGKLAAAEGGINAAYQTSANTAVGRDPLHNTISVMQLGMIIGASAGMLRGAYRTIRGGAGVNKSYEAAAQAQGYRDFNHMMTDLAVQSGWKPANIMEHWKKRVIEGQPFIETVEEIMQNKVQNIAKTTPSSIPRSSRPLEQADVEAIHTKIKEALYKETDVHPDTDFGTLRERKGNTDPAGTGSDGNPFFNRRRTSEDIDNDFTWFRGLNKDGTRATGEAASHRFNLFSRMDDVKFINWMKQKGARGYTELLQRIEANKIILKRQGLNGENLHRAAVNRSLLQMEQPPHLFHRVSTGDRVLDGIRATFTSVAKTGLQVAKNPRLLYQPLKDIFVDPVVSTGQFIDDLITGPRDGAQVSMNQRRVVGNLLRDWEGNRMAGELDIKNFTDWSKREISDPDHRNAITFLLEGEKELARYNAYRVKNGQKAIELTPYERQLASVYRKYLDDVLDWAQRSELFTLFRKYPNMYKQARRLEGDTAKDTRTVIPDDELWNFIDSSTDPRGMMWQVSGGKGAMGYYQNYVPRLVKREFAPTHGKLEEWSIQDAHRAGQLQTRSKFLNERRYETTMDAIEAGEKLYTTDIADLLSIYSKSMVRSQINARFLDQFGKMRNIDGQPMMGKKSEVPEYYVPFKHPNFRKDGEYLYVHPNMAPDMRLYFDTSNPNVANRVLQNLVLIAKRSALGLSLFHVAALGWSGLVTGQKIGDVVANVFPESITGGMTSRGLRALRGTSGIDVDYAKIGLRNGVGLGAIEELKGDTLTTGLRNMADWTERIIGNNKYFKPLGGSLAMKPVAGLLRGVAKYQELIDTHLWDHVNSGLKMTTFLTTMERMVYEDAERVNRGVQQEMTDLNTIGQRAAQFTNDAYGNQNWAQMAMNVENFMGHRIAAAMNKPSMRGYIRLLVFAPDWSLSNLRVMGKAFTGLVPGGKKELAHAEYARYALRSAVLFATINETLQMVAGQPSMLQESGHDLLYADLGEGRKLQISKQLAEFFEWVMDPMHTAGKKLSNPVKSIRDANTAGEAVGNFLEGGIPITVKQMLNSNNVLGATSGAMGVPYYTDKYWQK